VIKIIIVAHCDLASELVNAVLVISGKQPNLYPLERGSNDSLEQMCIRIGTLLKDISDKDGVLILVDVFGGTPCTASVHHACADLKVEIISGVNLSMVLSAVMLSKTDISLSELADNVLARGQKSISNIKKMLEEVPKH
jgi:mannose/fructose/sorbose-specific phosphotransferase system IIA component